MIINSNINSLNSQRQLANSTNSLKTSTERLSSGLRINIAADDAAGMAISDRMTAQIRGLNQARRNANDGISLVQTAEGALIQMTNNLQRIRELSVQAANDTNTATDRQTIQKEVEQLKRELTRIAETTQFNGRNLLDGKFSAQQFQVGANSAQTISVDMNDARGQSIGNNRLIVDGVAISTASGTAFSGLSASYGANGDTSNDQSLKIFGKNADAVEVTVKANSTMADLADAINEVSGRTGVSATARTDVVLDKFTADRSYTIGLRGLGTIKAADISNPSEDSKYRIEFKVAADGSLSDAVARINAKFETTGVRAQIDSNNSKRLILSSENGQDILLSANSARKLKDGSADADATFNVTQIRSFERVDGFVEYDPTVQSAAATTTKAGNDTQQQNKTAATAAFGQGNQAGSVSTVKFGGGVFRAYGSIEISSDQNFNLSVAKADGSDLAASAKTLLGVNAAAGKLIKVSTLNTVDDIDVSTRNGANDAIKVVDAALATLDSQRADLGAIQNRLTGTISNLRVGAENLSAARSRIQDSDYAEETAALSRATILQQAGTAMLAQANQQPQLALQLLR